MIEILKKMKNNTDLSRKTAVGAMEPANMFTIIRNANPWKYVIRTKCDND